MGCSVHPQNIGQLFDPPTFRALQSFLQSIHNRFVSGFSLAVALRISQGGTFVLNAEITVKLVKGSTIELQPIVRYEGL